MVSKTMNNGKSSIAWRLGTIGAAALAAAGVAFGVAAPAAHAEGWARDAWGRPAWVRDSFDYARERAWGYYAPPRVIYQPAPHGYFYRDR